MALAMDVEAPPQYPVRLTLERPEKQSKLLNIPLLIGTLIRLVLLVPNILILYNLAGLAFLAWFVSLWGILFTGRYPRGLFKLVAGTMRWYANMYAYLYALMDDYPPMDLDDRPERRLHLEMDYPDHPSRWLNLPFLPLKILLIIPSLVVVYLVGIVAGLLGFIAQFAILFTGSYPAGLHKFVVGTLRWNMRIYGYLAGFTEKYPPFSLE